MEYVLICQSLFVWINHSDELSVVNCRLRPDIHAHEQLTTNVGGHQQIH